MEFAMSGEERSLDPHIVRSDAYDRSAARRVLEAHPRRAALIERGARLLPHADALLEDFFSLAYKLVIELRPKPQVPRATALARTLLTAAAQSPGLARLREHTLFDADRAAEAALDLFARALTTLVQSESIDEDDLIAAHTLAKAEEEQGDKERLLRELEKMKEEGVPVDPRLVEAAEKARKRAKSEKLNAKKKLDAAIDGLPPSFAGAMERATERAGEGAEEKDQSVAEWEQATGSEGGADARESLRRAEELRGKDSMDRLARIVGHLRHFALSTRRSRRLEKNAEEVVQLSLGDDLARVLPAELGALRHPIRRLDVLRRLVDGGLLSYELRAEGRGRGPLVVCVDGSGSMSGAKELWAKGVALALAEIARKERRRAEAIVFAGSEAELSQFALVASAGAGPAKRIRPKLASQIDFAACFPNGGTDFVKPLDRALSILEEQQFKRGDIVFITDGEATIDAETRARIAELKRERDIKIYGVLVDVPAGSQSSDAVLREFCDAITRVSKLTADSVKELFESI